MATESEQGTSKKQLCPSKEIKIVAEHTFSSKVWLNN